MSTTQPGKTEGDAPLFEKTSALFDDIGATYQDAFRDMPGQQESLKWLVDNLRSEGKSRATILDVGCGTGRPTAETLSAAGHDVTGIDVSSKMVEVSRQQVPAATFHLTDAQNYEPGTQYDAVTAYFALLDEKSRKEVKEVIGRIYSWIKPGGHFIYATVRADCDQERGEWMGRTIVMTSFPREEWLEIMKEKGFEILQWKESEYQPHAETSEEPQLFIYARKR